MELKEIQKLSDSDKNLLILALMKQIEELSAKVADQEKQFKPWQQD